MYKRRATESGRFAKRSKVSKAVKKYDDRRILRSVMRRQLYPFSRFQFLEIISGADGTTVGRSSNFKLSDLPNYTEFTALFDQFRISRIKYRWVVNRNPDYGGAVVTNIYNTVVQGVYPRIMWVHDYDGGAVPANFADLQQYPSMKEVYLTPDKPYTKWYYIKPARLAVEYETAALSAYRPTWSGYLDVASVDTPFYGIRMFADGLNTGIQLRLECWYELEFKNVR